MQIFHNRNFGPTSRFIADLIQNSAIVLRNAERNPYAIYRMARCPMVVSDFKVVILFNVKQRENSTRQSYSYNGRLIGSRT